jgi:peptidoglycan/xylan/chitin deacetylase (PgdA/CDA1 family)
LISRFLHSIRRKLGSTAVILMYHQIDSRKLDPWQLAVSPENFEEQLRYLKRNYLVLPMQALAEDIRQGSVRNRSIAITFDDGFRDNFVHAVPLLEKYKLPATFYIATGAIGSDKVYWWDELQQIIFETAVLPEVLEIVIGTEPFSFRFQNDAALSDILKNEIQHWHYGLAVPNERVQLFLELWERIKSLRSSDQQNTLTNLLVWSGGTTAHNPVAMSLNELQAISRNPLFSIGAHTVHHAMLSVLDVANQSGEIGESKTVIEKWLDKKVVDFAYPYGNYNTETKMLVEQAGFKFAVSTEERPVRDRDAQFELPRVQVKNWSMPVFKDNLNRWMKM